MPPNPEEPRSQPFPAVAGIAGGCRAVPHAQAAGTGRDPDPQEPRRVDPGNG